MFYNESADSGVWEATPDPIADNTVVTAVITGIEEKSDANSDFASDDIMPYLFVKFEVVDEAYKARKINAKVRFQAQDEEKKAKANKMLMAIDYNCGGHLAKLGRMPDLDYMLSVIKDKPMKLLLKVWAQGSAKGNWIQAIYGANDDPQINEKAGEEPF